VILDIGCSSGFFLHILHESMPQARLIGCDFVPGPLRAIRAGWPDLPLVQLDVRDSPIRPASVDAAVMLNVLEHLDDDRAALESVLELLRPGGMVHIEVPAGPGLYDVYDRVLRHYRRYTLDGIVRLVESVGFDIDRAEYLGSVLYPAFALVKLWNRRHLASDPAVQRAVVARSIKSTSSNVLLEGAFAVESLARRLIRWPFGIRCVLAARRPASGFPDRSKSVRRAQMPVR
jgi:SAM-dependent methyltransferase